MQYTARGRRPVADHAAPPAAATPTHTHSTKQHHASDDDARACPLASGWPRTRTVGARARARIFSLVGARPLSAPWGPSLRACPPRSSYRHTTTTRPPTIFASPHTRHTKPQHTRALNTHTHARTNTRARIYTHTHTHTHTTHIVLPRVCLWLPYYHPPSKALPYVNAHTAAARAMARPVPHTLTHTTCLKPASTRTCARASCWAF